MASLNPSSTFYRHISKPSVWGTISENFIVLLYLRAATMLGKYARYDEKW